MKPPVTTLRVELSKTNILLAVLSLFIPGLGQLCKGRPEGLGDFAAAICLWIIWLGWIIHLLAAWDLIEYMGPDSSGQVGEP